MESRIDTVSVLQVQQSFKARSQAMHRHVQQLKQQEVILCAAAVKFKAPLSAARVMTGHI